MLNSIFSQAGEYSKKKSRIASWRVVTLEEIYTKLGLLHQDLQMLSLEIICKYLHFSDNEAKDYSGPSKLCTIFPVISHLNSNFKKYFLPSRNISIDEYLTLWKGSLFFKQYLPLLPSWDTEIHSSLTMGDVNKTTKIVSNLSQPLLEDKREEVKKGKWFGEHSSPISALKWSDKKIVSMMSTYHGTEMKIEAKGQKIKTY
ncbi:hypothetical protein J437_LFUL019108 [Ladona fulva]|uniref:PiggyBac transposable element-derived protein domain-containing protein n=1 Tax=Ladona fulva TaxID=123851 RepID=A0A8K0KRT3_LADFU|nr:hypothetical protein J437_LFUL019108 [Ladona fulva]